MDSPSPEQAKVKPVLRRKASILRRLVRSFVTLKGSPEQIALGASIGMFVAFSPTIGIQIIVALFLATILNASRPATLIPIWITNPLTIAPIYTFTYWLGHFFWPGADAPVSQIYNTLTNLVKSLARHGTFDLIEQFKTLMNLGAELFMPMLIGGIILGAFCAVITYLSLVWILRRYRDARSRRKSRRRALMLIPRPDGSVRSAGASKANDLSGEKYRDAPAPVPTEVKEASGTGATPPTENARSASPVTSKTTA